MLVIGHRGASAAAPENTPEAFRLAREMGADGVELDVRDGPDGSLVVHHDPLPHDEAELADLPRLDEVLDSCADLLVNVEIKSDGDPSPPFVERTLDELVGRGHAGRYLISSFSRPVVEFCRTRCPEVPTALLVVDPSPVDLPELADRGHAALHPHVRFVDGRLVERCHRVELALTAWTCNDMARIAELADLAVDGVCTDLPDSALAALGRDGPVAGARWGRPA